MQDVIQCPFPINAKRNKKVWIQMQESKERNDVSSSPCYEQSKVASNVNRIDDQLNLYIQFLTLQEKKKVKINFRYEVIKSGKAAIAILAIGPPD
jgi:hypothetical protein